MSSLEQVAVHFWTDRRDPELLTYSHLIQNVPPPSSGCGSVSIGMKTHAKRGSTMFNSGSLVRTGRMPVLALVLVAAILSGCKSKQEQALDQAKRQAATTGQAQQVVSVDKNGNTTTTVVQPPAAGQTNQAITTTVTPPAAGAPVPAPSGPVVSAVPQPPPPWSGQREHPGGHDADHPDRSAHQRKNQPRGGHVYRRGGGPGAGQRQQCVGAEGCAGGWRGGCVASSGDTSKADHCWNCG